MQRDSLIPPAQISTPSIKFLNQFADMFLLRFQYGFDFRKLGFELNIFSVLDYEGWVADYGAEEFFFGYLFEVGEAEFGEEFLSMLVSRPS